MSLLSIMWSICVVQTIVLDDHPGMEVITSPDGQLQVENPEKYEQVNTPDGEFKICRMLDLYRILTITRGKRTL